jgi:hypothetical protein
MPISTKQDFIDYAYRQLGAPVLQINIDQQQAEDRLEESLLFMYERHFDFNQRSLFLVPISQQDLTNRYFDISTIGSALGAQLKTDSSGATQYWPAANDILTISKVYPLGNKIGDYIFDIRYQLTLYDFFGLYFNQAGNQSPLASYMEAMSYLEGINDVFNYPVAFTYQKTTNRLWLDIDPTSLAGSGYILIETYTKIDEDLYPKVWDDRIFRKYYIALLKKQWAQNLSKFNGIPLPGGASINAASLMSEAMKEIAEVDAELRKAYEPPIDPLIG